MFPSARALAPRRLVAIMFCLTLIPLVGRAESASGAPTDVPARGVEPVVLTGALLPDWSRLAADGMANPYPSGSPASPKRDAHNGTLVVPPDARPGVPVDDVVAYSWDGQGFVEVPVQVDEKFPYFLANSNSSFSNYSGTDEELTYEWDVESWKKTAGRCEAEYPAGAGAMQDPVLTLDDDDEIAFMASDAGSQAPLDAKGPAGTTSQRQEIRLVDPRDPTSERFVYLFLKDGGSSFTADNGYVDYERHPDADQWIDRDTFTDSDPEILGSSNRGYGPNLSGTVCTDDPDTPVVETERQVTDRFPRDGLTVTTDTYRWNASGRWMIREMQVTQPGAKRQFGDDLIDRWKGRAFQQSPDSVISLVGFEDEQVNWEANSALIGELTGPVRAIREVWGADSGTNVTKTETFYRDSIAYRYRVRVHPIPPDGLYTSWDYNSAIASTYYNESNPAGVAIDGKNDELVGNIDSAPNGDPAFFDAPDPTFTKPLAFMNWEQVSGKGSNGSLVYLFEMKNAQALQNPLVVPYYRDDACLDDGTGDDPSPRAWPGESYKAMATKPGGPEYIARPCYTDPNAGSGPYRQGAFGSHGIHYFITGDTDNAFSPFPLTEIDGQQWQIAVPTSQPTNVGDPYANTIKTPLVPIASLQASTPGDEEPDEPRPTSLTYTGDGEGQTTDTATLSARLDSSDGPVAGETIRFTLDGQDVGTATTGEDGMATLQVTLTGPARSSVVTAEYAGDEDHAPSSTSGAFEILREDTSTSLTMVRSGPSTEVTATLTDQDSGDGLEGRAIRFFINGTEVRSVATDPSGTAHTSFHANEVKKGDTVTARFAGDDTFHGSEASETAPK